MTKQLGICDDSLHNDGISTSSIDNILYFIPNDSNVTLEMKDHLCKLEQSLNLSSHDAIVGKMILPINNQDSLGPDYSSTYTPFVVNKPKWNESGIQGYQEQSFTVLHQLFNQFDQLEHTPVLCELLPKMLVICAEKNFDSHSGKEKITHNNVPHFTSAHRQAYEQTK